MSILDGVQRVLSLYAEGAVELSFTDVATRLSLPKSTTSRLLNQMQRHGLLDQDASSRRYRPASCCRWRRGPAWLAVRWTRPVARCWPGFPNVRA